MEFAQLHTVLAGHLGAAITAVHFDILEELLWVGDNSVCGHFWLRLSLLFGFVWVCLGFVLLVYPRSSIA
jgi:hypothetical protein